jgi:hypothetical protein
MIQKLNYFFTRLFDYLLYPFSFINEFWGILFLSVLMSFVVLYIYKWVSSPKAIKNTKNQIKSSILAIRLYKDLWKVIVASFFKSLYYTFKYFTLNFGPVLLIIPILFPAFVQMDIRYGLEPFQVGDEIVIKAAFEHNPFDLNIKLMENEHFKPKMNPVFINAHIQEEEGDEKVPIKEVNWKVETLKTGVTVIRIKVGDKIFEKRLVIGATRDALSNKKMKDSALGHFIYPAEPLLPGQGEVGHIYISYPGGTISFAGISMHWLIWNLILVVLVVLALKNRFGIEF